MSENAYSRFPPGELILRDELALERTRLANERTVLAYLRSSVALVLAGVTFLHFSEALWFSVVGALCLLAGIAVAPVAVVRYRRLRATLVSVGRGAQAPMEGDEAPRCPPLSSEPTMSLRLPALDPATLEPRTGSSYPEPYRSRVLPREKRALGDAFGLTRVGVNLTTLPPGKESSMRHWHTREDELIYIVEGEVVLVTDAGEQVLTAGMCCGFPAGQRDGHQLVNRSAAPARYLEISNRDPDDTAEYTDVDLAYRKDGQGKPVFTRKDGRAF